MTFLGQGTAAAMLHITAANEPYPSPDMLSQATTTHTQGDFRISSRKLPISKSGPIDDMSKRLGIPIPEMIFGDNLVSVTHVPSGWAVSFTAEAALDQVEKTDRNMLQVAYAGSWSSSREQQTADIKEVVKPFDWSYSTTYRGTEAAGAAAGQALALAPGSTPIPLELLKRRDPILFFDEVMLYESELDDNGISIFSVKVRVMAQRMLLLCRLYMRLDNVVVRVRDTRVYVDFAKGQVIREYTAKEDSFNNAKRVSRFPTMLAGMALWQPACTLLTVRQSLLMSGLLPDAITVALRDANQIANLLPIVDQQLETLSLGS